MPPLRLPSTPEARAPVIAAALSAMKETDPGFDANSLLRALPARYLALRRAAAKSDDARLRVYLTPALLEHWSDSGPDEAPAPPGAGDLSVQEVRLVWAERLLWEDRLTVGVDSLAMAGEEVHALTEYWTLARRRGLETDTGAPATECASCGAPAAPGDDVCHYCDAELPGPLRGWLLDRLDQDVDWYEGPAGFVV
jgi:inner membrane protein import complex subunit Tim44-like protein